MPKQEIKIADNLDIKKYADRIMNLMNEKDGISEDMKELFIEAESNGVKKKALRDAIKYYRNEFDRDHAVTINEYLEKMGGKAVFDV